MRDRQAVPLAWLWAISLVAVWIAIAVELQQSLASQQSSRALLAFGAIKGRDLTLVNAWRLVAAQWLHVNAAHMLLNAAVIAVVGGAVERRTSRVAMVCTGLAGGTLGAWASTVADPDGFVSGASQAYLALCGAALILLPRDAAWWAAVAAVVVAIALDAHVAGTAKAGHVVGFLFGLACGGIVRWKVGRA